MNRRWTRVGGVATAITLMALAHGALALGQPDKGGPPPGKGGPPEPPRPRGEGPRGERGPGMFDPAALRARLERRLEELTQEQTRVREAIERLGNGASPEEIGRGMAIGRRGGRPDDEGPRSEKGERRQDERGMAPQGGPPGRPMDRLGGAGPAGGGEEDREALMEVLREAMPELAKKIESAREADPEVGRRMFLRWEPRLREAAQLKRHDPELFELRIKELREGWSVIEATRAAKDLGKPDRDKEAGIDAKRAEAKSALHAALAKQFDARLAMQSHEVTALSTRLEELRARLEQQRSIRDQRLDETLERIMSDKARPLDREETDRPSKQPPAKK